MPTLVCVNSLGHQEPVVYCTGIVTAMAGIDVKRLRDNPFWRKKIDKVVEVRDVNMNGYIERADFELILSSYKRNSGANPTHIAALSESIATLCDGLGLADDSKRLTYTDFREKWLEMLMRDVREGKLEALHKSMFDALDAKSDDRIDMDEWRMYYKIVGIPVEHASASFEAMDTNRDGFVSRDEFSAYHDEFFFSTEDKLNSSILFGPLDCD